MPSNEKEINNTLFDQLTLLERLEEATKAGNFEKVAESIRNEINRKLYQKAPITGGSD